MNITTRVAAITLTFGVIAACLITFFSTDVEVSQVSVKSEHNSHCGPACGHVQSTKHRAEKTPAEAEAIRAAKSQARAFSGWVQRQASPSDADEQALSEGLALAKLRRAAMMLLIQQDPDAALEQAIGYAEYAALPAAIQALVEKPFSTTGHLEVQIACGDGISQFHHILEIGEDGYLELSMPENHRTGLTKSNLPVQGIELGKQAVVRGQTFQALEGADAAYVAQAWPAGQADPSHCFLSGETIQGEGVTAVAGGMVFQFQDLQSLQYIENLMAEADTKLGMNNGSSWLIVAAAGGELEQFPEPQFNEEVVEADYTPATGAKTAFFILVDFPDASGNPDPSNILESNIDTVVDDALQRYSYNQTSMEATVFGAVFGMPSNTTTYTSGTNYNQLYNDALAAYIDSGGANRADPRSTYDTVGLLCVDAGFGWAGLASVGGQKMWLDGTTNNEVILHEFGHNYGLRHAEYWVFDNSNGSSTDPVDPAGASQDYGDSYDVMGGGNVTDGHFNPGPKAFLNWIPSNGWEDLTDSADNGLYRIYRFDHESSTGSRALRVAKSASNDHYWVGFRKDYASIDDFANGASLTWEKGNGNSNRNQTWLVDTTPGSAEGKADSAITLGRTYSDNASDVHITAIGTGGSAPNQYLDVTVNFGPFPGNNAPTGDLVGETSINARQSLLFNVEATDTDGDTLAYFWDLGDGVVKPNSATIAHSWLQGGSYDISVTVSDMKGGTVTLQQTVTVTDPLNTWTSRTSGTTRNLYGIASNDTHSVIVGERVILRSSDGSSWSNVTPGGFSNVILRDVCWTGSEFVAAGQDHSGTGWEGEVWSSADGSSWSRIHETNVDGTELRKIACDSSGTIVATAYSSPLYRRSSGGSWSTVNIGIPSTKRISDIAFGDGVFALVGFNYDGSLTPSYSGGVEVWTSSGGLSWVDRSSGSGLDTWKDFRSIYHTGERFLTSGFYSRTCYSSDGAQSWATNQVGDTHEMDHYAAGAGLVYALGSNHSAADVDLDLISSDGENWTALSPGSASTRNGIDYCFNSFISIGNTGAISQSGVISASTTYTDFTTTHFPGGGNDALSSANPDADWADNLTEFALGGDPNASGSAPSQPVFSFDGSDNPVIDITRATRRDDVAYSVWWSTDLSNWTRQGLTIETDTETTLRVVVDGQSLSGGKGFLRLQIQQ